MSRTNEGTNMTIKFRVNAEKDPDGLTAHTPGAKLDAGKVDLSLLLLFPNALTAMAEVAELGAKKYSRGGFLKVGNGYIRYTGALLRHLFKSSTEDDDGEILLASTRFAHDAQVLWNAAARLEVKIREEKGGSK